MSETIEQAQPKRTFSAKLNFLAGKGKFNTKSSPVTTEELAPVAPAPDEKAADAPVRAITGFNFRHPVKKDDQVAASPEQVTSSPRVNAQPHSQATETINEPADAAPKRTSSAMFRSSLSGNAGNPTNVSYKGLAPEKQELALEPGRLVIDEQKYFENKVAIHELKVTASAAKSLTRLFAALSLEPGSGAEVPADIRRDTLNNLITASHVLADQLCQIVMQDPKLGAPDFLRAKLLQGAADFISKQWVEHGRTDTEDLLEMAQTAFSGNSESVNQEVVDLFGLAEDFTPATSQEISDGRITESVLRETWSMIRQVEDFNVSNYDPDGLAQDNDLAFSYGKEPAQVACDLMKTVLSIVNENRLQVSNLDLYTNFMQNSIRRASTLVRAEYKMLTDRALRSAFLENLYSEAALNNLNNLYPQIIEKIASRARNGFIRVERSALDAMSAASYRHYLPKVQADANRTQEVQAQPVVEQATDAADVMPEPARTPAKSAKLFFRGSRNANA